jgi:CheY-like chemotaxis protein
MVQLPLDLPARAVSEPRAAPLRLLVVEDERELGRVFADFLRQIGHEVEVVETAEAALERMGAELPHAILLDVNLPGMSGLDFMALPAVRDSGVPIIVVSGYVTEAQARECLRLGAVEFLAKPVPLDVLATVLDYVAVLSDPATPGPMLHERRRASRLPVTLPLRVKTESGVVAAGAVTEVSATGLLARLDHGLTPGTPVRLSVSLPDGGAPVDVLALVVRSDGERMSAFWFLDVTPAETTRLLERAQAQAPR